MANKTNYQTLIIHSAKYKTLFTKKFQNRVNWEPVNRNHINSFIPGTIVEVNVKKGQTLKAGETLLILEAMKMNNKVMMPFDGKITQVNVKPGMKIPKNFLMVEIEPSK